MAWVDVAGQEQPRRLGYGGHQLELGHVAPVVLAVSQLHQAIIGDGVITTAGVASSQTRSTGRT